MGPFLEKLRISIKVEDGARSNLFNRSFRLDSFSRVFARNHHVDCFRWRNQWRGERSASSEKFVLDSWDVIAKAMLLGWKGFSILVLHTFPFL